MLEEGRRHRERTGKSLMVPRYDIVPIPQHVRDNLAKQNVAMFPPGSIEMFPAETAQSMFDFRADDVVGKIAPRPLLLLHSANDSVTPTEQSIEMFKRAGQPAELHLFSGLDHFAVLGEQRAPLVACIGDWLRHLLPGAAHVAPAPLLPPDAALKGAHLEPVRVRHDDLARFIAEAFAAKGMSEADDAAVMADVLIWANLRGGDGHGVARLPRYLEMIDHGDMDPRGRPHLVLDTDAFFILDAGRAAGPIALMEAVLTATERAKARGAAIGHHARRHPCGRHRPLRAGGRWSAAAPASSSAAAYPFMPYHGARKFRACRPRRS